MEDQLQKLVDNYKISLPAIELVRQTPILLLVGISGAGKDTTRRELATTGHYHNIVSHTTRVPRTNNGILEQEGVEYHFVSKEQAAKMLENGEFIEAKKYGNNIYGTSIAELAAAQAEKKIALADIEIQGVSEYKSLSSKVLAVFLLPPSYEVWLERLRARYGGAVVDQADLTRRMQTAVEELGHALATDYFVFVVNSELYETVKQVDMLAHDHATVVGNTEEKALARELLHNIQAHLTLDS